MTSDVYQDLFGEGSFIGKGIYDVDAFERTCGAFPDNTVVSHDLIESAYARSALLSDVEVYEHFPSGYPADVSRRHRWIRGDWQIVKWLLPAVPTPNGGRTRNTISALSWWKIFDNLRRSLFPVATTLLLLAGWIFLSPIAALGTVVFVSIVIFGASLLYGLVDMPVGRSEIPFAANIRAWIEGIWNHLLQAGVTLLFVPFDAYLSVDAISRTLVRMFWTRKKLLEWKTSREAERRRARGSDQLFSSHVDCTIDWTVLHRRTCGRAASNDRYCFADFGRVDYRSGRRVVD